MSSRAKTVDTAAIVRQSLQGRRFSPGGVAFEASLLLMLLISLAILVTLLADIIVGALPVFRDRGLDFVTSGITLDASTAGVWTGLLGAIAISVIVAIVAFPLGVGAAVYLEEYAPDNSVTRFLQTNIRNLAGVPSIVYGLLGLAIFVRLVDLIGLGGSASTGGRNVIAAPRMVKRCAALRHRAPFIGRRTLASRGRGETAQTPARDRPSNPHRRFRAGRNSIVAGRARPRSALGDARGDR